MDPDYQPDETFDGLDVCAQCPPPDQRQLFIENIQETYRAGVDLIKRKNADYAGANDPFKNFRSAEVVGVPVGRAILVRTLDKMARISNLLGSDKAQVKDEAITDTLTDCINYLAILKAWLEVGGGRE